MTNYIGTAPLDGCSVSAIYCQSAWYHVYDRTELQQANSKDIEVRQYAHLTLTRDHGELLVDLSVRCDWQKRDHVLRTIRVAKQGRFESSRDVGLELLQELASHLLVHARDTFSSICDTFEVSAQPDLQPDIIQAARKCLEKVPSQSGKVSR